MTDVGNRALRQNASAVVASAAAGQTITIVDTLDAVHLAASLQLGDDLDSIVTYDDRLAEAALSHGIPVTAPA